MPCLLGVLFFDFPMYQGFPISITTSGLVVGDMRRGHPNPKPSKCVRSDGCSAEFFNSVAALYRAGTHCDLSLVCGGGRVVRCHAVVLASVTPPKSKLRRFLFEHLGRTAGAAADDDVGGTHLSLPHSSFVVVRETIDAVYDALVAAGASKSTDVAALQVALERIIGVEGTEEVDAFLPDKELRIVIPRLKLEQLDRKGVLDIKPKIDEEGVNEFDLNSALDVEIDKAEEKDGFNVDNDFADCGVDFGLSPAVSDVGSDKEWEPETELGREPVADTRDSISALDFPTYSGSAADDDAGNVVDCDKGVQEAGKRLSCQRCSYATNDSSNFRKHVKSRRHLKGGKRKYATAPEDASTNGHLEKVAKRGRPRKYACSIGDGPLPRERVFTPEDEGLFSFATKQSDGSAVVDYDTLGGVQATAKHLVTKGGRLTGVPENGAFVGRRRREKKSPFCALVALKRQSDSAAFKAVALAGSDPESEEELAEQFGRVWAACKAVFGCSDHDVAAEFMPLWRQPNSVNGISPHQIRSRNYFLDGLKHPLIKGLRQKLCVKTEKQLRKDLEEAEVALKTSVTLVRGEARPLVSLSRPLIDLEFVPTAELPSSDFESLVFLEWRHGGLVTYSGLGQDCFERRLFSNAVYDTWRSNKLPVGKSVAKRFEDAVRPSELVKEIELVLKKGMMELCPDCGIAVHRRKFKEHRKWHVQNSNTTCPKCSKKFDTKLKMLKHAYNQKHIPDLEKCNYCSEFGSKSEMAKHAEESHKETHICDACGKEFKNPARLSSHMMVHRLVFPPLTGTNLFFLSAVQISIGREFKCGKCGATVMGYKRWWEHRQVHEGRTTFPCEDCGYVGQGGWQFNRNSWPEEPQYRPKNWPEII